jgi:hypothetical protein
MSIVLIKFPNESDYIEVEIDMANFSPDKEHDDEVFGWYKDTYISIKK